MNSKFQKCGKNYEPFAKAFQCWDIHVYAQTRLLIAALGLSYLLRYVELELSRNFNFPAAFFCAMQGSN